MRCMTDAPRKNMTPGAALPTRWRASSRGWPHSLICKHANEQIRKRKNIQTYKHANVLETCMSRRTPLVFNPEKKPSNAQAGAQSVGETATSWLRCQRDRIWTCAVNTPAASAIGLQCGTQAPPGALQRPLAYGASTATGWALACSTWRRKRLASFFAVRQSSSPFRSNS